MTGPREPAAALRALGLAEAAWGAALLAAPGRLVAAAHGGPPPPRSTGVARVLGARQLAQGALTALTAGPRVTGGAAAVEGLHGTSMVALAAASSRYRRLALVSAAVAATEALAGGWLARAGARRG